MSAQTATSSAMFISTDALLDHWQGHRGLTRRMIEAYPEDKLFSFSVGEMRPFGELVLELIAMGAPMVRGLVDGHWDTSTTRAPRPKAELLRLWDEQTEQIDTLWNRIPPERFQERLTAFGQYEDFVYKLLLYVIDNEIHHRGQAYVYMRALGLEPPAFWQR